MKEVKYCPCCGSSAFKDKKKAQNVFSCSVCCASFLVIVTTKPISLTPQTDKG